MTLIKLQRTFPGGFFQIHIHTWWSFEITGVLILQNFRSQSVSTWAICLDADSKWELNAKLLMGLCAVGYWSKWQRWLFSCVWSLPGVWASQRPCEQGTAMPSSQNLCIILLNIIEVLTSMDYDSYLHLLMNIFLTPLLPVTLSHFHFVLLRTL